MWDAVVFPRKAETCYEVKRGHRTTFRLAARVGIRVALRHRGGKMMAEPQVTLDSNSLNPVEEKLRGPLEQQLTSALQAATEKTKHEYAGEDVDQVTASLLKHTKAGLHHDIADGFNPDPGQLRNVAEQIVAGADTRDLPRPR
jgi:hypothetical protein